jgi:hypothetical protein
VDQPLYQVQTAPGDLIIPGAVLPSGQLLVKWLIDIPSPNRALTPSALLVEKQVVAPLGSIRLNDWVIEPSYPLAQDSPLTLIQLTRGTDLLFQSLGYSVGRISIYPYVVPTPLNRGSNQFMGVNISSASPPAPTGEDTNVIAATSAAAVSQAAKANRSGGYIENTANSTMWVKWGIAADAPVLSAVAPFNRVPSGANIDIPSGYAGVISMIWTAKNGLTGSAIVHEVVV